MIHDDLVRQFEQTPQPTLSPAFSSDLRRTLRHSASAGVEYGAWRTWVLRFYWVAAAAMTAHYYRPVDLTSLQIMALVMVGAAVTLTLRRVAKMGPLTRVLRDVMWR